MYSRTLLQLRCFALAFVVADCLLPPPLVMSAERTASPPDRKPANKITSSTKATSKSPATAGSKKPKLTPEQLRAIVEEKLSRNPNYTPGSLLSHRDVEPIFNYLLEKGVTIAADHEALYDSILPDNAPLVKLLKTPNGRDFMKKIGTDAAAYERLERLSWTYDGRRLIEKYMSTKDGLANFRKLKTPAQVAKLSKELAADPRTDDFALPTGHVHTASELLEQLEQALKSQPK